MVEFSARVARERCRAEKSWKRRRISNHCMWKVNRQLHIFFKNAYWWNKEFLDLNRLARKLLKKTGFFQVWKYNRKRAYFQNLQHLLSWFCCFLPGVFRAQQLQPWCTVRLSHVYARAIGLLCLVRTYLLIKYFSGFETFGIWLKIVSLKTERNWSHWENVSGLCCFYPCYQQHYSLETAHTSQASSTVFLPSSYLYRSQFSSVCGASYLCGILKFHSCGWWVEVRCVHRSLITSGFLGWTQELLLSLTYFVISGNSESQSWACALRILPQAWVWDRSTVEGRAGKGGRGRALLRWKPGWGAVWEQCHHPFLISVAQHHQGRMTLQENGCVALKVLESFWI